MVHARIEPVGPNELPLILDLFNQVFSPAQEVDFFARRFRGRHNVALLIATIDQVPVGFTIGFELMPTTYFQMCVGVLSEHRRCGVATQLMHALQSWATDHHYRILRFECQNQHRPMLHVAITEGYDLVGLRHDTDSGANVVVFEKDLG